MDTLTQAIKYLELGWSVIPLIENSKRPSREWKEFQNRKATPIEAISLFPKGANLGLVCGDISGILVIDDDSYKKKTGDKAMDISSPLYAMTPRGGKHYFFRYKEGRNTVNQELSTDIRSKGGYVVLPPSVVVYDEKDVPLVDLGGGKTRRYSGAYSWAVEPTKEILEALPYAPESLLLQVYGIDGSKAVSGGDGALRAKFDVSSSLDVSDGGRNSSLSPLALSLLNKHPQEEAWMLLKAANNTYQPPLEESEVLTVFNSALQKFRSSPPMASVTTYRAPKKIEDNSNFKKTSLLEDVDSVKKIFLEGKVMGELTGFSPLDSYIGGYIAGQSYLIYADTSVGKSIFAINSLVALSSRGVKTVYFDLENPLELTIERLAFVSSGGLLSLDEWRAAQVEKKERVFDDALKRVGELSLEVWDLNKLTDRFGGITWEGVKMCIEESILGGARVVVLDHLHYFSPSVTDHAVLGEVMREINNLCAVNNLSIVVVAHTKKGLTYVKDEKVKVIRPRIDDISGSSLIGKHCKNIISLQRNSAATEKEERQETTVYVDKTKFGPTGSFKIRFSEDQLCFFDDGKSVLEEQAKKEWDSIGQLGISCEVVEELPKPVETVETPPTAFSPALPKDPLDEEVDKLVSAGLW